MKQKLLVVGGLFLLCAAALAVGLAWPRGAASAPAAPQAGGQWEYLIVAGGSSNISTAGNDRYPTMRKAPDAGFSREAFPLERNMDKLGAQGWELVSVGGSSSDPVYYFKRPRREN